MEKIDKIVTVLRHSVPEKDDAELVELAYKIIEAIKVTRAKPEAGQAMQPILTQYRARGPVIPTPTLAQDQLENMWGTLNEPRNSNGSR